MRGDSHGLTEERSSRVVRVSLRGLCRQHFQHWWKRLASRWTIGACCLANPLCQHADACAQPTPCDAKQLRWHFVCAEQRGFCISSPRCEGTSADRGECERSGRVTALALALTAHLPPPAPLNRAPACACQECEGGAHAVRLGKIELSPEERRVRGRRRPTTATATAARAYHSHWSPLVPWECPRVQRRRQ